MARYLLAATPIYGHVAPLLAIGRHLTARGHDVTFLTGSRFHGAVDATGARHVSLHGKADYDDRRLAEAFPDRARYEPGPAQLAFDVRHLFGDAIPAQDAGLRDILRTWPADAVLVDMLFMGAFPSLLDPSAAHPPIVAFGIAPVVLSSQDTAPYGSALPPDASPEGRARNTALHRHLQDDLLAPTQAYIDDLLGAHGWRPLPYFVLDALYRLPDLFLQLTAASFEYPRSDAPASLHFIGPLPPAPSDAFTPPPWWGELEAERPVVVVTQGTFGNADLGELIGPTLTALADLDVTVVATTGGAPLSAIPVALPANGWAAEFIPFDQLLPRADLLVTNGGYGGVNQALGFGVPLVVAGDGEDKPEIAARVAWAGAGINLGGKHPAPEQIRAAVQAVLTEPRYRERAHAARVDFARHHPFDEIDDALMGLVTGS